MDGLDLMTVGRDRADHRRARCCSAGSANFRRHRRSSPRRCSARCSVSHPSTGRWRKSFSATSAACRSACWSAGACCSSPGISTSRLRLLLPLYYLADATVTLLRPGGKARTVLGGAPLALYQRATDNGFSVSRVVSEVFALNILLAALAIGSVMTSSATSRRPCFSSSAAWRPRFLDVALLAQAVAAQASPALFCEARGSARNSRPWLR